MRAQMNSKRFFLVAAAAFAAGALSVKPASAALLAYEPFDQTYSSDGFPNDASPNVDGLTVGQTGFTGTYHDDDDAGIENGGLHNSLTSSAGNAIGRTSGNANAYYAVGNFDTSPSGNFAPYLESTSNPGSQNGYNIGAPGTLYFSFLYATQSGDTQNGSFLLLRDGNSGNGADVALNIGVTANSLPSAANLYVGEIVFGANDTDTLYSATNPTSAAALTEVSGPGNYSFDRMEVNGNQDIQFDEIRVGSSFADVVPGAPVPEPASVAIVGLSSVGLLARRRRRQ